MVRGIIFRPDMAQAIAEDRKTQTRRVLDPQPAEEWGNLDVGTYHPTKAARDGEEYPGPETYGTWTPDGLQGWISRHGRPGDYLYVREAWAPFTSFSPDGHVFRGESPDAPVQWRPSIHMPRWAARTWVQIDEVRVERVQEITEEDAIAEGVEAPQCESCGYRLLDCQIHMDHRLCRQPEPAGAVPLFTALWEQIHGAGAWERNPWVFVYRFHKVPKEQTNA